MSISVDVIIQYTCSTGIWMSMHLSESSSGPSLPYPVHNIWLVSLIYLGWELLCMVYITVLCGVHYIIASKVHLCW